MYLSSLIKKVKLSNALYITAYCFAQAFLPFGLIFIPLDLIDGTFTSVAWLAFGLAGLLVLGKRGRKAQFWALVFFLAAAFGGLLLVRFGVECFLLQSSKCELLPQLTLRMLFVGVASSVYLVFGGIFIGIARRINLDHKAAKSESKTTR